MGALATATQFRIDTRGSAVLLLDQVDLSPDGLISFDEVALAALKAARIDEATAAVEACITQKVAGLRYLIEPNGSHRKMVVRPIGCDGGVGQALWSFTALPGEVQQMFRARIRNPTGFRAQLRSELAMLAAGCAMMLDPLALDLVSLEDPEIVLGLFEGRRRRPGHAALHLVPPST